jgi:hypothetical protein
MWGGVDEAADVGVAVDYGGGRGCGRAGPGADSCGEGGEGCG